MVIVAVGLLSALIAVTAKYQPTWSSIDSRPLPKWYDEVKFGIFCHWGVYSVPAYKSEWLWWYWKGDKPDKEVADYISRNYKPTTTYADFARDFTAELFNAKEFADIVKSSGAKYFVLTSKHHEGFTLWPTKTSWNWNAMDIGPKRDLVGELREAFKGTDVRFGLYYSLFEWFHPMFLDDGKYNTTLYVDQVSFPQMVEIVNRYKPDIFWSDGDWLRPDSYWRSKEFLTWLYNISPVKDTVVVNDRWGQDTVGKHGGFLTFSDHYDPEANSTISGTYDKYMGTTKLPVDPIWVSQVQHLVQMSTEVNTVYELIVQLARTISCGGNLLLNIGPDMHGRIPPIFEDRLRELGSFLQVHSEAVYGTKPWIYQNDTGNVWYTSRVYSQKLHGNRLFNPQVQDHTVVYAWVLNKPTTDIKLERVKTTAETTVTFLGTSISYTPSTMSSLVIPSNTIPWKELPRRDVMILKIERAATQTHSPVPYLKNSLSSVDFRWTYDAF